MGCGTDTSRHDGWYRRVARVNDSPRCIFRIGLALGLAILSACGQSDVGEVAEPAVEAVPAEGDAEVEAAEPSTTTTTAATTTTASTTTTTAPIEPAEPLGVTLLDAGAEPRQLLRFALTDGSERTVTTSTQTIEQLVQGVSLVPPQPIETITRVSVERVAVDGGVQVRSEITDAAIGPATDPELADFIGANFAELIGITTTVVVDDRGLVNATANDAGASEIVVDLLGDSLSQSTPLPGEAVGVGASWVTEANLQDSGVTGVVRTTWTLREFTDNGLIVDLDVVQEIANIGEAVDLDGVEAIVEDWNVSGTGAAELDLRQFSAVTSEVIIDGVQRFSFGDNRSVEQRITTETRVETVP